MGNWRDWHDWDDHFEDWHAWNHDHWHDDWHHGHWHGHWDGWCHDFWDEYPVAAVFGVTAWGLNTMGNLFGYYPYYNPYYTEPIVIDGGTTINYSEPLVTTDPAPETSDPSQPTDEQQAALDAFDRAREEFLAGNYDAALSLANQASAVFPDDATVHEFRSLALFALGKYREAAAGLYAVLSAGPGWDWTTMSSLYPDQDVYTEQLRKLEQYQKDNPQSAEASFVLGYQYLTCGYSDAAAKQFKHSLELNPKDRVARILLAGIEPESGPDQPTFAAPLPAGDKAIASGDLRGTWSAQGSDGAQFTADFDDKGNFTWTYKQGAQTQKVTGVFDVDGNTLAMEPDSGGMMLATMTPPAGGKFRFQMIGAPAGDPGLEFSKAN